MTKRTAEPTIATKTLRSHPWHDVHSITHRQMAELAPHNCLRVQMVQNGVRSFSAVLDRTNESHTEAMSRLLLEQDPFCIPRVYGPVMQ